MRCLRITQRRFWLHRVDSKDRSTFETSITNDQSTRSKMPDDLCYKVLNLYRSPPHMFLTEYKKVNKVFSITCLNRTVRPSFPHLFIFSIVTIFTCVCCTIWCSGINVKIKVKESRNRPGVAQRVPGGLGSQIL